MACTTCFGLDNILGLNHYPGLERRSLKSSLGPEHAERGPGLENGPGAESGHGWANGSGLKNGQGPQSELGLD